MQYAVDVQGFVSLNGFVVKELAIVPLQENDLPTVYLFKPPSSWGCLLREYQSSNKWLEMNFHGIPWSSGDIYFDRYPIVLHDTLKDCRKIYVKGLQKKKWLELFFPPGAVLDLDDLSCPSLKKLRSSKTTSCKNHFVTPNPVCAMQNADLLRGWILDELHKNHATSSTTDDYDEVDKMEPLTQCKRDCVSKDPPLEPVSESFRNSDEYKKQVLYSMYT